MRTIIIVILLVAVAVIAFAEEPAADFGSRLDIPFVEPVAVKLQARSVQVGPYKGLGVYGIATSNLPTPYFRVTITVEVYALGETCTTPQRRGKATVVLDNPVPGQPTKFKTVIWMSGSLTKPAVTSAVRLLYVTTVTYQEHLPTGKGRLFK